MVLAKEYRIPLPVSVEEYKIAQIYMIAKMSKEHTGHGEGVEVVENRPYEGADADGGAGSPDPATEKGMFTHKIYHIASKLPAWVKPIVPSSALEVHEKAWNAYPYCKTTYYAPFLGDRFNITIITRYLADDGSSKNALDLTPNQLKELVVDTIDIVHDPIDPAKYKAEEDPAIFVSTKTGRGKLQGEWQKDASPVMTSYKYATVEFRYWGLQTRIENYIQKYALRDIFCLGHRQAFCWIDQWFGLSLDDVREIETKSQKELTTLLAASEDQRE